MSNKIIDKIKRKYKNKKILIVGLGLQMGGVGLARFFSNLGAKVTATDKKTPMQLQPSIELLKDYPIQLNLGGHNIKDFREADFIFKGPSVLWETPEITAALEKGIPVEMEMSFVAKHYPGKIIGITGTRGKSTTTNLIFNLLKLSGFKVVLGGGLPGISTIDYLKTATADDYMVAELSSWALSGFHRAKISPHIAVLTNIYPDHLNYYTNIEDYIYDKHAIFTYQKNTDFFILNKNFQNVILGGEATPESDKDDSGRALSSPTRSLARMTFFSKNDFPYKLKYLRGEHNLENAAAAFQVARILGIDESKAVNIISNFRGLPFRQEIVGEKENIIFVNDTTSTTPIATIKALESFEDYTIILILGGNEKNLPFNTLLVELRKVEKIVLLAGSFTNAINSTLRVESNEIYDSLEMAVKKAYKLALDMQNQTQKKVCILFSPGATSFAMFNNEFHRGREFNKIVKEITNIKSQITIE